MRLENPVTDQVAERPVDTSRVDARAYGRVGAQFDSRYECLVEWAEADSQFSDLDGAVAFADTGGMAPRQEFGIALNVGYKSEHLHRRVTDDTALGVTGRCQETINSVVLGERP